MAQLHSKFIKENVAPKNAKAIGVFKNGELVGRIALGTGKLSKTRGDKLYSFGVMNDIHIGYTVAENGGNGAGNLTSALDFFYNYKVDFIACNGDICKDNTNIEDALTSYGNHLTDGKFRGIPVYTGAGNHENQGGGDNVIGKHIAKWRGLGMKSSLDNAVVDSSGFNFHITKHVEATGENHHIIIFSCINNDGPDGNLLSGYFSSAALDWLDAQLTACGTDRVYVFEHVVFPDWCNYGYNYSPRRLLNNNTTTGLRELDRLRAAVAAHPNAIWFTGHTHQSWDVQGIDFTNETNRDTLLNRGDISVASKGNNYDANIGMPNGTRGNKAWVVHVPACYKGEYAIVDVHADCVVIKGVRNGNFVPIAQYQLSMTEETSSGGGSSSGGESGGTSGGGTTGGSVTLTIPSSTYTADLITGHVGDTLTLPESTYRFYRAEWSDYSTFADQSIFNGKLSCSGNVLTFNGIALQLFNKADGRYNDDKYCWLWTTNNSTNKSTKTLIFPKYDIYLSTTGTDRVTSPVAGTEYNVMVDIGNSTIQAKSTIGVTCTNATISTATLSGSYGKVTFGASGTYDLKINYALSDGNSSGAITYSETATLRVVI